MVEGSGVCSLGNDPNSILFIGNSFFYYNNGINDALIKLIRATEPDTGIRITLVAISGAGADWHDVASYFRPRAIGSYSFDANNNLVFSDRARLFDVAILMDCSQSPIHPRLKASFHASMASHCATIREHGAGPVLFMTWAYKDRPEMTGELAAAYTRAGNENGALVIPAGLAFARAADRYPDVELYQEDKRHPSAAGTYLAACTTYATLFGRSPVRIAYYAGLGSRVAGLLQSSAWQAAQQYATEGMAQFQPACAAE
jgi:hypothetical protein